MAIKDHEQEDEVVEESVKEDVVVASDALESLNLEDAEMPSLISLGSFSDTFGRKKSSVERRISVLSNYSTYSEDSFGIENALGAATSAIAIARAGSTRTSRRSRKSVVRQEPEAATNKEEVVVAEDLVQVDTMRIIRMNTPEWPYVLVGLFGAVVMGGAMPVYAILFGEVLGVLKL